MCALSWLITEIILRRTVRKNIKIPENINQLLFKV